MTIEIIEQRLAGYETTSLEAEQDALREILQEVILYGLSTTNFFRFAAFHGGTSLRILYQLPRFSEDLDFVLKEPSKNFIWEKYFDQIMKTCKLFGLEPELYDRKDTEKVVQKMFLKDNSIGKVLELKFAHHPGKKLRIKCEIDTNPPAGSTFENKFVSFPLEYSVITQDLASNFANKCHALLCRKYEKGRDWFDFAWYVNRKAPMNFDLLAHAINQQGAWAGQKQPVDLAWFQAAMTDKINQMNWEKAADEVYRFLPELERQSLKVWGSEFFKHKLEILGSYLDPPDIEI